MARRRKGDSLAGAVKEMAHEMTRVHAETERALQRLSAQTEALRVKEAASRDALHRSWGELSNRLGTIVEDIIAPNVRGVAARYFGVSYLPTLATRFNRGKPDEPGSGREFDVIAYTDSLFFFAEAKTTPRPEYAKEFVDLLPQIPGYFPESAGKRFVPIFASLQIPADVVKYLTRHGVYCMVMGEENTVFANFDEVESERHVS